VKDQVKEELKKLADFVLIEASETSCIRAKQVRPSHVRSRIETGMPPLLQH